MVDRINRNPNFFEPKSMEEFRSFLEQNRAYVEVIEQLSGTHITWFTHKNPYGCWICDLVYAYRNLADKCAEVLYPSPPLDTA